MTVAPDDLAAIRLFLEQNPPAIGINNILGYTQFLASAQTASVATAEGFTVTSSSYADLATAGPSITGLPSGKYLVLFSCQSAATPPTVVGATTLYSYAFASIGYGPDNAVSTPSDDDAIITTGSGVTAYESVAGFKAVSLSATKNTVTMQYRLQSTVVSPAANFKNRRLLVLRYATL